MAVCSTEHMQITDQADSGDRRGEEGRQFAEYKRSQRVHGVPPSGCNKHPSSGRFSLTQGMKENRAG